MTRRGRGPIHLTVQAAAPQPERKKRLDLTAWVTTMIAVAAFATSVYTVRQSGREQAITDRSQVNTWFDTAVNELASSSPDVRMGGIFQLERIARDSAADQPTVVNELAAFVREHAAANPAAGTSTTKCPTGSPPVLPGPDVQAAVTVIGSRRVAGDGPAPLNLTNICLAHVDLDGADLTNVDLAGSDLTGASLVHADLARADVAGVQLGGANLSHTDLARLDFTTGDPLPSVAYELLEGGVGQSKLSLVGADLAGSDLSHAKLSGIDMTGADLAGADLSSADLSGAVLNKANLVGANLSNADLVGAKLAAAHMEGLDLQSATLPDPSALGGAYLEGAALPPGAIPDHVGTPPTTFLEQAGTHGSGTFADPDNAAGPGARIAPMAYVQVACRVYAPAIAAADPDGWWYKISNSPWNGQYYAPANTFWNGDVPGQTPYTHNTDFSVSVC